MLAKGYYYTVAFLILLTLLACELFTAGYGEAVDLSPPEITIDSPTDGFYVRSSFILKGTVTDDIGINKVVVEYTDNTGDIQSQNATIGEVNWSVDLETSGIFDDGEVIFTVTATDSADKKVSKTRMVFVDNTVPTVLINSPGISDLDILNGNIVISGVASDQRLRTVSLKLISTVDDRNITTGIVSGTNSWKYDLTDSESILRVDETNNKISESFYISITAEDYAGNVNTFFYYNDELSSVKEAFGGKNVTIEDLADNSNNHKLIGIQKNSSNRLTITIDPDANKPKIKLSDDWNYFVEDNYKAFASDAYLSGRVLDDDGISIITLTIRDLDNNIVREGFLYPSGARSKNLDVALESVSWSDFEMSDNSGAIYLAEGIYTLNLEVEDIEGVTCTLDYPAIIGIDKTSPEITFTSIGGDSISEDIHSFNSDFVIEGTAEDLVKVDYVNIYVGDLDPELAILLDDNSWSYTVPVSGLSGKIDIKAEAVDGTGKKDTDIKPVYVDGTIPSVIGSDIFIPADVNGNITITGKATDNQLEKVEYSVGAVSGEAIIDGSSWSFNLDTTEFYPDPYSTIEVSFDVRGTDSAGNISPSLEAPYNTLTIDENSDNPIISFNYDMSGYFTQNDTISGTVTDDDGVKPDSIVFKVYSGTTLIKTIPATESGIGQRVEWSVDLDDISDSNAQLPQGSFSFEITATDDYTKKVDGLLADEVIYTTTKADLFVDNGDPTLVENSLGVTSLLYKNSDVTISGTVVDGNIVESVVVIYSKDGGSNTELLNDVSGNGTWTTSLPISLGDGVYDITITATDGVGNSGEISRRVHIDTTAPELTVTSPIDDELIIDNNYTIRGQITDNGGKGVEELQYSRDNVNWTDITLAGLNWSVTSIDFSTPESGENAQGERNLYVRTTDNLNPENKKTISFNYDTADPVLAENTINTEVEQISSSNIIFNGSALDTNELASLSVSINGGLTTPISVEIDDSWTYTLLNSTDGSYELNFVATDVSGRTTTITRNIVIDTTDPDLPFITSTPGNFVTNTLNLAGTSSDLTSGTGLVEFSTDNVSWSDVSGTSNWFKAIDISGLSEGSKTIYIRATDRAGNISSTTTQSYNIDRADPVLTEITVNSETQVVSKNSVVFNGVVSDSNSLSGLTMSINGGLAGDLSIAGDNSWTSTVVNSTDGTFNLEFVATDIVGKTTVIERNVFIDATIPLTPVINSVPGAYVTTSLAVNGTAIDSGSGLLKLEYSYDNSTWNQLAGTDSWSGSLNISGLSDGSKTLYVRSTDNAGNESINAIQNFIKDNINPTLTVTGYVGTVYRSSNFVITGWVSDNLDLGVSPISVSVTRESAAVDLTGFDPGYTVVDSTNTNWTQTIPIVSGEGSYEVVITGSDAVGRLVPITKNIIVDTEAPTLVINNLSDSDKILGTSYTVTGTASEVGVSGINEVLYSLDSGTTWNSAAGTSSWSVNLTSLTDGLTKSFIVKVNDNAGNESASTSITYIVDTAKPESTITGVGTSFGYVNSAVTLSGIATDNNGVTSVIITSSLNGAAVATLPSTGTTSWSIDSALTAEGVYDIVVSVTDGAGETKTYNRSVGIDTSSPDLTVTSPVNSELIDTSSYILRGQVSDNGGVGVTELQYSRDDTTWTDITMTGLNWTVPGLNFSAPVGVETLEGVRTLYVRATDGLNTESKNTIVFNFDVLPPVLTETTINTDLEQITTIDLVFNGVASDTNSLTNLTVSDDGGSTTTPITVEVDDTWTYTQVDDVDGSFNLIFTAIDGAGRTTVLERNVLVDATDPVAPTITSSAGTYVIDNLSISGIATDVTSGVSQVTYSLNNSTWFSVDGTDNWFKVIDITGQDEGLNTIFVRTTDGAGNVGPSDTQLYYRDIDNPELTETGINTESEQISKDAVVFSGVVSDSNALSSFTVSDDGGSTTTPITVNGDDTWTYTLNNGSDGTFNLEFVATDAVNKTTVVERNVLIDITNPTTPVISSVPGAYVTSSLSVNGTASDTGSGLTKVEYSYDNSNWNQLVGTDTWSGSLDISGLSDGSKTLYVRSKDNANNVSTNATQNFIKDNINPTLSVTGYVGTVYRSANFVITGSISDNLDLGVTPISVSVTWESSAVDLTGFDPGYTVVDSKNTNWTQTIPIVSGEGSYEVVITGTDNVGRPVTITKNIVVDTQPPTLVVNNLSDSDKILGTGFTVTGTASEVGVSGINQVLYSLDSGSTWNSATGNSSWSVILTGLTDSLSKTFMVKVNDNAGNESGDTSITYIVDTAKPVSTVTGVGTSFGYVNSGVTISGTATDNNGITSVVISSSLNGAAAVTLPSTGTTNWTIDSAITVEGVYDFVITVTDGAAQVTTYNRSVGMDTSSPDLTVTTPVNSELIDTANYTLRGQVSDNGGVGVTELQYSRDDTNWTNITMTGLNWTVTGVDFSSPIGAESAEGGRTLYVRTTDSLNAEVKNTITFNYDTESPILTETTINTETELITASDVIFNGVASDTNALTSLTVSDDGGSTTSAITVEVDNTWSYTHPNTTDGTFALEFVATDASGRETTVYRNILTDDTVPTTPIITSTPGNYVTDNLSISGTASDVTSGVILVEYSVDNSTWFSLSGTDNWFGVADTSTRPQGSNDIFIRTTDRANKVSLSGTQAYIKDTANPVLTETSINTAIEQVSNIDVVFNGVASDYNSINSLTVSDDGGTTTTPITVEIDNSWTYTLTNSVDDVFNLEFVTEDSVGKTTTIYRNILIDTTDPSVAVSTDYSTWKSSTTVSVTGTASDEVNGSGLKLIEYKVNTGSWVSIATSSPWTGFVTIPAGAANNLYIRSTDNANNINELGSITVMVDTSAPVVVDIVDPASVIKVNGTSDLAVDISLTDVGSGIVTANLKVDSSDFSTPDATGVFTANLTSGNVTFTVPSADILAADEQTLIYLQFIDDAGNTTVQSFQIFVDKVAPSVPTITSHSENQIINKTITLSGTSTDDQGIGNVIFEVFNDNSGLWELLSVTGTYSWNADYNSVTLGTTDYDYDSGTAGIQVQLRVTAEDEAGNSNSLIRVLNVDQNTDRPIVTLNNIDVSGTDTLKLSTTIYGSVTDDDGITSLEISQDNTAWSTITLSGGAFQYSVTGSDGAKMLYFRVVDNKSLSFATNLSDEPRVIGKSAGEISDVVNFRIDTVTPEIFSTITADRLTPFDFAVDADTQAITTNMPFGGTSSSFAIKVLTKDANNIDTVDILVPGLATVNTTRGVDESGYEVYTTAAIDISGLTEGSVDMLITVTDASGLISTASRTVIIDNTAPDISYLVPSHLNTIVNGDVEIKGLASDNGSGLNTVEYKLGYNYVTETWQDVSGSLFNWQIDLTGAGKSDNYAGLELESADAGADTFTLTGHGYTDDTPVWINADVLPTELNYTTDYYIINSTANTFQVSTSIAGAAVDFTTTGTAIRVSKYSKDSDGDSIWELPVILRSTDLAGNISSISDTTYVILVDPSGDKPQSEIIYPDPLSVNRTMGGIIRIFGTAIDDDGVDSVYMQIDVDGDGDYEADDIANDATDWFNAEQGVLLNGTASWNMSINTNGEFNPVSGTKTIYFRIRVKDIHGLFGPWSTSQLIEVDNSVPKIGSTVAPTLTQGGTEQAYISDMYIKGDWVLEGTIEDESGISDIQITGDITGSLTGNPTWFNYNADFGAGTSGYEMLIPVPTTGTGILEFSVEATDSSDPATNNSATFRINYDNEAPTLQAYAGTTPVEQSNKTYELTSTVLESGSGLERVAFYFLRQGTTDPEDRVYNPMEVQALDANRTYLNTLTMVDGLPRLDLTTGITRADEYSLTHASIIANTNVRVGGLVKIGGLDRVITSVNNTTGEIQWSGSVSTSIVTASIAYALIVNNLSIETPVWSGETLVSITNDDGDGVIEGIERAGGSYDWTASIDSREIPDGPIEIHWVAYDKSGNYIADLEVTEVLNNRPLLASVILGTDLNGDSDTDDAGEKLTAYSLLNGSDEEQAEATSDSSAFTAKGLTTVDIDVLGGNGALQYTIIENATTVHTLQSLRADGVSPILQIDVTNAELIAIGEGSKNLIFKIWDSTEETTAGTDSQWAELTVPMQIDVVDSVAPKSVISEFFWTDTDNNSLYNNSRDNGYIEVTGVFDGTDPDVSGIISIRGTAYDDQRIDEIYARIDSMGMAADSTFNSEDYEQVSIYTTGSWSSTGTIGTDGWQFTAADISIDQTGHRISWQMDWDTSKITNIAELNRVVKIVTLDKGSNPSGFTIDASGDDTINNVPIYQVDVVPYITGIENNDFEGLSTDVIRTSTGKYSMDRHLSNTFNVYGFNLGDNASNPATSYITQTNINTDPATGGITTNYVSISELNVSKDIDKSGYLTLFVNSIPSVNNLTVTNAEDYNKEIELAKVTSTRWTDDRYLWMWDGTQINISTISPVGLSTTFSPEYGNMEMNLDQPEFAFHDAITGNIYYTTDDTTATLRTGFRLNRYSTMAAATIDGTRERFIISMFDSTQGASGDNAGSLDVSGFVNRTNPVSTNSSNFAPSLNRSFDHRWAALQGVDYYSDNLPDIYDNINHYAGNPINFNAPSPFRWSNRFPHPKILAEDSFDTGADLFISYYDASPNFQGINYVSFNAQIPNGGESTLNGNFERSYINDFLSINTAKAADFRRSPMVITIPQTLGGNSSEYYDIVKVGNSGGIAVAYHDNASGNLKLAYSSSAYLDTTGTPATDRQTDRASTTRGSIDLTLSTGTRASYSGKYFTLNSGVGAVDVWFDITGTDTRPAGAISTYDISVDISGTTQNVASMLATVRLELYRAMQLRTEANAVNPDYFWEVSSDLVDTLTIDSRNYGDDMNSNIGNIDTATVVGSIDTTNFTGLNAWSVIEIDSATGVGQYVSAVTDGSNIYIAYYDFFNAALKMAKVSWDGTGTPTIDGTMTIDNYLSTGIWSKIELIANDDLTGQGITPQPFISYYANSYNGTDKPIRMAFPLFDATTTVLHGTDDSGSSESFSGSWECVAVPAYSAPRGGQEQFQEVSIGKDTSNLPVLGWTGATKLEYSKLLPNN